MIQKLIEEFQDEINDDDEAHLFAEWVKERSKQLEISQDYFLMEFI